MPCAPTQSDAGPIIGGDVHDRRWLRRVGLSFSPDQPPSPIQRRLRYRESRRFAQLRREQTSLGSGANRAARKLELRSNKKARQKPSAFSLTAPAGNLTSRFTVSKT